MDDQIENGMDADRCAQEVVAKLLAKQREIPVGESAMEMGPLEMKRSDPEALFDMLEGMAADLRAQGVY
jgi:hypothetical protein